MMKIDEIKKMKKEDMEKEITSLKKELLKTKEEIEKGKEKNVRKGLRIKRNIARIHTVLNELERKNDEN